MAPQTLASYSYVKKFLDKFVEDNKIDIDDADHADFWNTLKYEDFVGGNVPGIAQTVRILVKGDPDNSNLIKILNGPLALPDGTSIARMPEGGPYMSPDQVASLAGWIHNKCPQ
jgi:hypothetical protein